MTMVRGHTSLNHGVSGTKIGGGAIRGWDVV